MLVPITFSLGSHKGGGGGWGLNPLNPIPVDPPLVVAIVVVVVVGKVLSTPAITGNDTSNQHRQKVQ